MSDAAERPDEGEVPKRVCGDVSYGWSGEEIIEADAPRRPCVSEHGDAAKCRKCYPAPAAPVGEPLCKCGPTPYPGTDAPMEDCPVHYPPPAPLSSPRRTRDEGTEDEAEAAWEAFDEDNILDADGFAHAAFVAGFRAARLDELEHEVEGLAWRNQQLTERLEQYTMTDPIDLNARREQRVPEPDGEPAIVMPMDTDGVIFRDQAALDEYVAGAIRAARLAGEDDRG